MVILKLLVHLFGICRGLLLEARHVGDDVLGQVEAIQFVQYPHIEGSRDGPFFTVAVNEQIVVVTIEEDILDQSSKPWKAKKTGLSVVK